MWYNKIRTLNNVHISTPFNHSMLYILKGSDTNKETYTMPAGIDGLYIEDIDTQIGSRPDLYIWPSEVWSSDIWFAYVYLQRVTGTDTAGVFKITVPQFQRTKYAAYRIETANLESLFDDTLKIKYFDTQEAAETGPVSGSITENSHYYEFVRDLPPGNYDVMPW